MTATAVPPPDLTGKTCLITGATSGIGLETAKGLGRLGADLVLVGRDAKRCEAARDEVLRAGATGSVAWVVADLSSLEEVRRLADHVRVNFPKLSILINNAGAAFDTRLETADGIERTWALNHLSCFLLTNLLLDTLKANTPARVVNVASDAHRQWRSINWDDVEGKGRYSGLRAYAQSKLANILFTAELARRLDGARVTANALHPGFVATRFFEGDGWMYRSMKLAARFFAIAPEAGARTSVYVASSPELDGVSGRYFARSKESTPSASARDPEAARRLWALSEEMTGLPVSR
jgi:retinol dehydrogenase 12